MYAFGDGDGKFWLNDLLFLDLNQLESTELVTTQSIASDGRLLHSDISFYKKIYISEGEPD